MFVVQAAWGLFTPVLNEIEESGLAPELYPYGSRGPVGAHYLAAKCAPPPNPAVLTANDGGRCQQT